MLTEILIFNFMMFGLDAINLMLVWRYRSWLAGLCAALTVMGSSFFLAIVLGGKSFAAFHLLAYGLMLHLPLVLLIGGGFCWSKGRFVSLTAIVFGLVGIAIAIDAVLIEPYWLQVTRHSIVSDRLQTAVRVAIVADLQTDQLTDYEEGVFQIIKAESPDLILFAGDYLQLPGHDFDDLSHRYREFFKRIGLNAPLGVYAVGGNVDNIRWPTIFEGLPVEVVDKTNVFQTGEIQVTGLSMEDSFDVNLQVPAADRFHIVLGHSPDYVLGDVRADLMVAGHTHGGQVQIPGFGPLLTLSKLPRTWCYGRTELPKNGGTLIVSRGIGMERGTSPRLRFFCRPELVFVDLVPVSAQANRSGGYRTSPVALK